jgi:hypothetical protein
MVRAPLIRRIEAAEARTLPARDRIAFFVTVEDASMPNPDGPPQAPFRGDADVIGVIAGVGATVKQAQRVSRKPGESMARLEARAHRLVPRAPFFTCAYSSLAFSREAFERLPEAGADRGAA